MSMRGIAGGLAVAGWLCIAGDAASAEDAPPTLATLETLNTILLLTDPLDSEQVQQCAFEQKLVGESLDAMLQRYGFPKTVSIMEDPEFKLPTFSLYAQVEPVREDTDPPAGQRARCQISAYAAVEMPAADANEFGWPRLLLWQAPMLLADFPVGPNRDRPDPMVQQTLQGMAENLVLTFIGAWQGARAEQ